MIVHDRSIVLADFMLGNKQAQTPEGFLLCKDVPIARIGTQDYLNEEIPEIEGGKDGVIKVERLPDDVFHPDTIASFEGKPVVDDHPDAPVDPSTFKEHVVGVTINVRRGAAAYDDLLLADLLIMDADAIAAVRAGKREVSCGYDAEYEQRGPGKARQYQIIGNHVALVDRGRCGPRCAIGDEEMAKAKKPSVMDRLRAAFLTNDKKAFDEVAEEAEGMMDEEDPSGPGVHVLVHSGPSGVTSMAPTSDEKEEEEEKEKDADPVEARFKKIEDSIAQMASTMDKWMKTKDAEKGEKEVAEEGEHEAEGEVEDAETEEEEEEQEEEEEEAEGDKKPNMKDSLPLKSEYRSVASGAEILVPGIRIPTFDGKSSAKSVKDSICLLRRRALAAHARTTDGASAIKTLTNKETLDLKKMTCDGVSILFSGAVGLAKARNASKQINLDRVIKDGSKPRAPQSIDELNRMKDDFFKTH